MPKLLFPRLELEFPCMLKTLSRTHPITYMRDFTVDTRIKDVSSCKKETYKYSLYHFLHFTQQSFYSASICKFCFTSGCSVGYGGIANILLFCQKKASPWIMDTLDGLYLTLDTY